MSIITLQIGQCGNQLGDSFYNLLAGELSNASPASQACTLDIFFDQKPNSTKYEPRSVLVDMEPKVIAKCLSTQKKPDIWQYNKDMTFCKQEGSGNNWAFGYSRHGPACKDEIFEKLSAQLERSDMTSGILMLQSLAGGTGSGVGSYLIDAIQDEYPGITLMNIGVMPHLTGEVTVQSYNLVLSLSKLYQASDAVLLIENDTINEICTKLLHLKRPNLHEMNFVISHMIGSVFYPCLPEDGAKKVTTTQQCQAPIFEHLPELLTADPRYKLLTIKNLPQMPDSFKDFSNDTWSGLSKRLLQMLISNSSEASINWSLQPTSKSINKSLANLVIARGFESSKLDPSPFTNKAIYSSKNKAEMKFVSDHHLFNKNQRSLSVLSNSQAFVDPLEKHLNNVYNMFEAGAFVYQYEKFGVSKDEMQDSLAIVEQIAYDYANL